MSRGTFLIVFISFKFPFKCSAIVRFRLQVFLRKKSIKEHIRICQVKARLSLIEDGMNEEEAALAVEPPLNGVENSDGITENILDSSMEDEASSTMKLKKFSIRLKRFWYIELAVEKGCRAVLMPKNRNFKPKPIW